MITIINDKELGKIEIVTQQYQLGLYVAIYKNKRLINQFGSNLKEVAYHRKVRIRAIKRGGTIVDGTILETKSKYPINTFEMKVLKKLVNRLLKLIKKDSPLTCSDCERWGTMDCPNSYMCYSTKDKPYFKSKHNGK